MHLRSKGPTNLQPLVQELSRLERETRREKERQDHLRRLGMEQPRNVQEQEAHGVGQQGNVGAREPIHQPREPRRIGDYDVPITNGERMGIRAPPCVNNNWEIKSSLINMVQNNRFFGLPMEHPIEHLDNFDRLCGTVKMNGVSEDVLKLTLFPFSLGDKASQWEKTVVTSSITTWEECKKRFLAKFFSNQKTAKIRNDIATFKQGGNESLYEAWERFKGYTRSCPHHGVPKEALLGIFHRGVHEKHYDSLNTASNGSFSSISIEEGEQLIENLAQSDQCYGRDYDRTIREPKGDDARIMEINAKLDKFILSTQKGMNYIGEFEGNKEGCVESYQEGEEEVSYMQGGYNNQPRGFDPNYRNHPNLSYRSTNVENPQDQVYPQQRPQGQGFIPQQNFQPQGYYQPKAPFVPNQQRFQPQGNQNYQGQGSSSQPQLKDDETRLLLKQILEGQGKGAIELNKRMTDIHNKVDGAYNDLNAKFEHLSTHMKTLDNQIAQVASTSKSPMNTLPGKSESNPKSFCNMVVLGKEKILGAKQRCLELSQQERNERDVEEFAMLLGDNDLMKVDKVIEAMGMSPKAKEKKPMEVKEEGFSIRKQVVKIDEIVVESAKGEEMVPKMKEREETPKDEPPPYEPKLPFPRPVYAKAQKKILSKFKKDMSDVGVIFPKNEDLSQVPNQIRFIKDILANHTKVMNVMRTYEKHETPLEPRLIHKKNDPGKFTIPCSLGDLKLDDALCDSGSCVNLISHEMVKNLGIKELKGNSSLISFADASSKCPIGMLEDYPLKVGNCVVPTDFMVVEMETKRNLPLILGTPFLATREQA